MKSYYLCPKKVWQENINQFSESHYLETDDPETILVVCHFSSHANADHWESKEGVELIPHPLMDNSTPAKPEHVVRLRNTLNMKHGDKSSDILKKAQDQHPAFKLHRF